MTDRDFNTLLAGIEAGLYRIASNEKLGVYGRQELADGALEAIANLRTRIEKVEALREKWQTQGVRFAERAYSGSVFTKLADDLTQALQGGET